ADPRPRPRTGAVVEVGTRLGTPRHRLDDRTPRDGRAPGGRRGAPPRCRPLRGARELARDRRRTPRDRRPDRRRRSPGVLGTHRSPAPRARAYALNLAPGPERSPGGRP